MIKQEIKRHFNKAKNDNNWDGFADFIQSQRQTSAFKQVVEELVLNSPNRNADLLHFLSLLFVDFDKTPIPRKINDVRSFISEEDFFIKGWDNKDLFSNSHVLFKALNILNEEITSMTKEDENVAFKSNLSYFHFIFSEIFNCFSEKHLTEISEVELLTLKTFCENCLKLLFEELFKTDIRGKFVAAYEHSVFRMAIELFSRLDLKKSTEYENIVKQIFVDRAVATRTFEESLKLMVGFQIKYPLPLYLQDKFFDLLAEQWLLSLESYIEPTPDPSPPLLTYHIAVLKDLNDCFLNIQKGFRFKEDEIIRANQVEKVYLNFANKISHYVFSTFSENKALLSTENFLEIKKQVYHLFKNKLCKREFLSFCLDNTPKNKDG